MIVGIGNRELSYRAAVLPLAVHDMTSNPVFVVSGQNAFPVPSAVLPLTNVRHTSSGVRNDNLVVQPLQPRELLAESLAVGDVHLMSLRPVFDGQIVPSKYCGVLAAARSVVFIGSRDNAIAQEIRREGLGATVCEGEVFALVDALRDARDNAGLRTEQGRRARALFEARYTRTLAVSAWSELLKRIAA
jgi:glycosyltransferase involved in cell wall biosynthesis